MLLCGLFVVDLHKFDSGFIIVILQGLSPAFNPSLVTGGFYGGQLLVADPSLTACKRVGCQCNRHECGAHLQIPEPNHKNHQTLTIHFYSLIRMIRNQMQPIDIFINCLHSRKTTRQKAQTTGLTTIRLPCPQHHCSPQSCRRGWLPRCVHAGEHYAKRGSANRHPTNKALNDQNKTKPQE